MNILDSPEKFIVAKGPVGPNNEILPLYTANEIRPIARNVPRSDVHRVTEERIRQAHLDAERFGIRNGALDPAKRMGSGEFAFVVHARNMADIRRQFPGLSPEYMPEAQIREEFHTIPAFRASRVTGMRDRYGKEMRGWVVISTLLPDQLSNGRDELVYAKQNLIEASKLAWMLGAEIIGLGGMAAMLTHYGRTIKQAVPELQSVTTGHTYTAHLMNETLNVAAQLTEQSQSKSTLAVVGAAGSIGNISAELAAPHMGRVILIDKENKAPELQKFVQEYKSYFPNTEIEIVTVAGVNDSNYNAIKEADFVQIATTQAEPYIRPEWLKKGAIVIDDSAPWAVEPGVVESAGGVLLHVVANNPHNLDWNFPFGLSGDHNHRRIHQASFGCGAEVAGLATRHRFDKGVTGEAKFEHLDAIVEAVNAAGFGLGPLQSFGRLITRSEINAIRRLKSSRNFYTAA